MNTRRALLTIALLAAGCGGTQPTPSAAPASVAPPQSTPTAAAATPATTEAPPSAAPVSVLEGTWTSGPTTCEQQVAAATAAGFTKADFAAAGWDKATCGNLMHGSDFTVRFAGDRLVHFSDDVVGWDGVFRVVDSDTFEAGDSGGGYYIGYQFTIDGDQLTIDMVRDDYPASSPEDLIGETLAQTVIYETAPFTRVP